MSRKRRLGIAMLGLVAFAGIVRHPSVDVTVAANDPANPAAQRVQTRLDIGLVAISVLITWTRDRFARG